MRRRSAAPFFLACLVAASVHAQQPSRSGIWPSTDMVGVPFERPAELGTRTELTAPSRGTQCAGVSTGGAGVPVMT